MGQRTTIVLQHYNKSAKKDEDKFQTCVFYHHWGIGRVLPSLLISVINGILSVSPHTANFPNCLKPQGCSDISDNFEIDGKLSFDNPEQIGDIIKEADNDNGGIFVRVTSNLGMFESVEYAYMLGSEDGGDYKSFCTQEEWFDNSGIGFVAGDFRAVYYVTISYYKAKERNNGEGKKLAR